MGGVHFFSPALTVLPFAAASCLSGSMGYCLPLKKIFGAPDRTCEGIIAV